MSIFTPDRQRTELITFHGWSLNGRNTDNLEASIDIKNIDPRKPLYLFYTPKGQTELKYIKFANKHARDVQWQKCYNLSILKPMYHYEVYMTNKKPYCKACGGKWFIYDVKPYN